MMKRLLVILIALAALAFVLVSFRWIGNNDKGPAYRTARIERGELVKTVRATGIIQPQELVDVGTQVTGPVTELNADFNSRVKAGQIIARIDPAPYEARVAQDKANLKRSMAEVEQARARLAQAERDLVRSRELSQRELISESALDAAETNRDTLVAQLKLAEATVDQYKAALHLSETNLQYTIIKSPVDGVVIARNVNEGQTVVANLQAQTLFVIATDLKHVEVEASIPEADIGDIRVGQPVTFTVDAYADDVFRGTVSEVRLSATTFQNVVTYPVIVEADNPEDKLMPGMTANITCEVARRDSALKLPNAALRFKPDSDIASKDDSNQSEGSVKRSSSRTEVWVLNERKLEAVPVTLGISDGAFTEIVEGNLKEGQEVVTGVAEAKGKDMVNPFLPQRTPARKAR
jgi:HlyD family secretion protein